MVQQLMRPPYTGHTMAAPNKDQGTYWTKRLQGNWQEINDFAKKVAPIIQRKGVQTLLDLGCGNGQDGLYFAERNIAVTCVDIARTPSVTLAAQNNKLNYVHDDLRNINFPSNSFDAVYAHFSLHYFDDQQTQDSVKNIYRILSKGGMLFVKCLSTKSSLYGQGEKLGENIYFYDHIRHFFSDTYMKETLESSGFKIDSIEDVQNTISGYTTNFLEGIATKT